MRERGAACRITQVSWLGCFLLGWMVWGPLACGQNFAPSPFDGIGDGGSDAGVPPEAGLPPPDALTDPTFGGACIDDGQCDDGIDCTDDGCDSTLERCRFLPNNELCADDVYCNGRELCEPGLGCRQGEAISCSDSTTCTIDTCVEATKSCEHAPRDADGDGDGVWNCTGGTDCDDKDPLINGSVPEVCANGRDDDCDQVVDEPEPDCARPMHDTCADALRVEGSGSYALSLVAAGEDYALSCAESGGARRDVVVELVVPDGDPTDVDIVATTPDGVLALAADSECSLTSSELGCAAGFTRPMSSGSAARLVLRDLAPGSYAVVVSGVTTFLPFAVPSVARLARRSAPGFDIALDVRYGPAPPAPSNETCGTALPLVPGQNVEVDLGQATRDVSSRCDARGGDVVYRFRLTEPQDVELSALSLDDLSTPMLSLRGGACVAIDTELGCRLSNPATLFMRRLPAGTYFAVVGATGASRLNVVLDLSPPTVSPADEGCTDPPELELGQTRDVNLAHRMDVVESNCAPSASDATYALSLLESSDVLLVERLSSGDAGAVSLMLPGCDFETRIACGISLETPVRARALGLAPGDYRVVGESVLGAPISLTAFARKARPATLVAFADACDDAISIPEDGGRFTGNTANAAADFEATCDFGSGPAGGAPDQMLALTLTEPRRVVLDMGLSGYDTLLAVREATDCPGPELMNACAASSLPTTVQRRGLATGRSYLDLDLPVGDYFVQIDGYDGASGSWVLDVFTAPL